MPRRRLAVLTAVSGLGISILAGSASLVAAQSDDCPTPADTVDTTPDDPHTDGMDQEMTGDGAMDTGHDMTGGGHMGQMHHEMMAAMHEAMTGGGGVGHDMGHTDGDMMATDEEMISTSQDADGVAGCDGEEHARHRMTTTTEQME